MTVRVNLHNDVTAVDREAWGALTARPPASVTGSMAWLEAALGSTHRGVTPLLLTCEIDSVVVGLLPLAIDASKSPPEASFIGSPYNDLSDILIMPGHEREAAAAILEALCALSADGISVTLHSVDPEGVLATADAGLQVLQWSAERPAPTVTLDRDLEAVVSGRRRRTWGNRLRRLEQAHTVEFRPVEGSAALSALPGFARLRELRRAATGRERERPPVALVDAAVNRLAPDGASVFMDMLVDGVPVARDLYLVEGDVALMWLRGLDPAWQPFPCGHLLLCWTARHLRAGGYEVLDMGRGDEPYKFIFGASRRVLLRGTIEAVAGAR
ncbi:MAG TPA: GNAT family N-acetyltransferase [Solirubrobacterales bacterium]|nr:GNAT family N-acetyltransferase [Solirubrobacterales bacterium]